MEQITASRTPMRLNGFINGRSVFITRDNPDDTLHFGREVSLYVYDRRDIAGGRSVYQISEQPVFAPRSARLNSRRGDLTLLINGMPLIHVELRCSGIPVTQACNQIEKYAHEGVFTGLFSLVQVFVAMEPAETLYFANPGEGGDFSLDCVEFFGILMFSDHIHTYFRYARIEVVDLPDPTGQNMVEKTFTGPIQRQLRDALTYIKNYMLESKIVKFADRAESQTVFNYPYAAVEEILSNAVYHRSYKVNEPITVRKTPDALEITSYPGFDRSIKDSDIQSRNIRGRIYRNRRIGDFLKELHLIEGRNTGFPTTFRALADNGSPMPDFQIDENRNYLSVILHVHPAFQPQESRRDVGRRELEQRILDVLPERPVLISELARLLGYKGITKRLRITVDAMLSEGTLRSVRDGARNRIARP